MEEEMSQEEKIDCLDPSVEMALCSVKLTDVIHFIKEIKPADSAEATGMKWAAAGGGSFDREVDALAEIFLGQVAARDLKEFFALTRTSIDAMFGYRKIHTLESLPWAAMHWLAAEDAGFVVRTHELLGDPAAGVMVKWLLDKRYHENAEVEATRRTPIISSSTIPREGEDE
jgi:hypothetical protein